MLTLPFAVRHQRVIRKVGLSCVYREFPLRVLTIFSVFIDDGPVVLFRLLRTSTRLSSTRFWSTLKKYRRGILYISSLVDFLAHPSQPALDPTPDLSRVSPRKGELATPTAYPLPVVILHILVAPTFYINALRRTLFLSVMGVTLLIGVDGAVLKGFSESSLTACLGEELVCLSDFSSLGLISLTLFSISGFTENGAKHSRRRGHTYAPDKDAHIDAPLPSCRQRDTTKGICVLH